MTAWADRSYAALPVPAQNLACTWMGWRRARMRFGAHFRDTLTKWEASGSGSLDGLHAIQRERLGQVVQRARATTEHYRTLPPASCAHDPLRSIEDTLAAIPELHKHEYRAAPERFLCRDVPAQQRIAGKTSGTTGTALPLWYTRRAVEEEFACIWRQRRHFGVERGDPNLTFNGQIIVPFASDHPPFWRVNHYAKQTLFSLYHMKAEHLENYIDGVHQRPARYAQGYPSSLYLVAQALLAAERPLPTGRLAAVFTSSESLLAYQRDTIERAFGAPVRDRYGVSELAVSMTECEERNLHVDMEFGIVEVDVTEENDVFERGELLVTGFANDLSPFLRYRVGDIGTRSKRPCACGRPGDVFLDVDGRVEDYVATPDGRLVGRLDHVFKEQLDVAEAQILQKSPDALEVLVVRRPEYTAASERGLLKEFRSRLGEEIQITLSYVEAIPREANGKFRAVKSTLGRSTG